MLYFNLSMRKIENKQIKWKVVFFIKLILIRLKLKMIYEIEYVPLELFEFVMKTAAKRKIYKIR